jgi:hypothetical protein
MDFFDKLNDTIVETGKNLGQKAKETSNIAKLSYDIRSLESKVRENYRKLGKAYYEEYHVDEDAEFEEYMDAIRDLKVQIIKGTRICPNCGEALPKNAVFCLKCGEKIDSYTVD